MTRRKSLDSLPLFSGAGAEPTDGGEQVAELILALGHRQWLDLLADEWWPRMPAADGVRLGVGRGYRALDVSDGRVTVLVHVDPQKLPDTLVTVRRDDQWVEMSRSQVAPTDRELVWPGPVPLFAVNRFSVADEAEAARLKAMIETVSKLAPDLPALGVHALDVVPPTTGARTVSHLMCPPADWDALRGAAHMAVWAVPKVAPWLDTVCSTLSLRADAFALPRHEAWLRLLPWNVRPGGDAMPNVCPLWRAVVDELRGRKASEGWAAQVILGAVIKRAEEYGVNSEDLQCLDEETRAILSDDCSIGVERGATDPVGHALQLVLLRPLADDFGTWKNRLPALSPAVWWMGAILAGWVTGYRQLDKVRFAPTDEGRRAIALRTWRITAGGRADVCIWPEESDLPPTWEIEEERVNLRWNGRIFAQAKESARGAWFRADLLDQGTRAEALKIAREYQPACTVRVLRLADSRLDFAGGGTASIEAESNALVIEGSVSFRLPADVVVETDLDDEVFKSWVVEGSVPVRLPRPPVQRATEAARDSTGRPSSRQGRDLMVTPDGEIAGLLIRPDFLSNDDEDRLIKSVDAAPWLDGLSRRVQHYGWKYDYKKRQVEQSAYLGPLPPWAEQIARRLLEDGLVDELPDQVIVNEYVGKQGIAKHTDCPSCFRGAIVTISLLESWEMLFRSPQGAKFGRTLPSRSVAVLDGDLRRTWTHEIPKRIKEPGGRLRGRRVSLTFRKVDLEMKNVGAER